MGLYELDIQVFGFASLPAGMEERRMRGNSRSLFESQTFSPLNPPRWVGEHRHLSGPLMSSFQGVTKNLRVEYELPNSKTQITSVLMEKLKYF
jgi:hypothetical protein